ncbi:sulfatase [Rhodopirellula sallentina]|uniref:Sulfatase family protein n=1 Tax=Rhodopirellula sallentina SM41 TaxID=1263870 RepID=M5U8D9_9BACT|nr:sulfatase [Rhodopirellula sallentina]EMI57727.1 sulfatase family protein [Rhodopirellula sallentina SM41]
MPVAPAKRTTGSGRNRPPLALQRIARCVVPMGLIAAVLLEPAQFVEAASEPSREDRPNVIVILTDDMGYADLGATGSDQILTPNIDRLMSDGVNFTNAYVTASVCCPSRAGLLTGRYQQRFGHEFNNFSIPAEGFTSDDMGLSVDERTIGNAFQDAGYTTMCVGKWHMGGGEKFDPSRRGFDEVFAIEAGHRSYWPYTGKAKRSNRIQISATEFLPEDRVTYLTDDLTNAAVDFIDRHREDPFFMYLAYNAPHGPMHGKEADKEFYDSITDPKRQTYAAMMKALDEGIGEVRRSLIDNKIDKRTLIIFTNDNGGATSNGSDNGPYRGMKGSKWEGGVRVPFSLTWPGRLPDGADYDSPVSTLDILPTSLAAAEISYRGLPLDGVNLLPYLENGETGLPHDMLFWRRGVAAAVRAGQWKLIRVEGNPDLLFNLEADPSERSNVAPKHPEKVAMLKERLAQWESELAPPKWTEGEKWSRNQVLKHQMRVQTRRQERQYP